MSDPEVVFAELQLSTPEKAGRAYRAFSGPDGLEMRAFIDGESRLPGLSVKVPKRTVAHGWNLPDVRGVQFVTAHGDRQSPGAITYELVASQLVYAPVFIELAARLIVEAEAQTTAEAALAGIARRIAAWARFFDARGQEALSRSAQLGLIGELLCLRKLAKLIGLHASIDSWTGPSRAIHDFQNSRGAIEVKLTTSSSPERFRITSERQLDESAVPWLALFTVRAQEVAAGDTSLLRLVDGIRDEIDRSIPGVAAQFEERLLESGYLDADRSNYDVCVTVHSQNFLHVIADFPRIRTAEIRAGVFDVSYYLAWSTIAPYRIADEAVRRIFRVAD